MRGDALSTGDTTVPELIITLTDGRLLRHTLGNRPETIGRDAGCDIPIDEPSTSRRHARFAPTPKGYVVEDLGSKNGTLVNDEPCTSRALRDGDQIEIGSVSITFSDEPEGDEVHPGSVIISDEPPTTHATRYLSRDQQLNLSQRRLQMIYELSERLTTLQSQEQLLENAMDICFETLQFERGAIGVRRPSQRALDWPVVRNLRGAEGELSISRSLLSRALQHGERAIFTDTGAGNTDPTVSMVQHGIRSAMCVPLMRRDQTAGVIYGDRTSTSASYTNEDIDFLAGIAQQVTIGLINSWLVKEQEQMARLQHDIDLARRIQTQLFPAALPNRENLRVAALNEPGQRVSGDYYDVIEKDDGRVWCLVADVTGEGAAAALLMANLQAAVRVTIDDAEDPAELLSRWNSLIHRNTHSSKFITCVLALIDPAAHRIDFATAGHCPPLVVRGDEDPPEELIADPTYPLGVVEEAEYTTTRVEVGPEPFCLFCYTDGVPEAMDPEGQTFGLQRLLDVLRDRRDINPQALVKQTRKSVTSFVAGAGQSDDITMLAARVS
jgi:sigma-B regulation protein RsbU (phosphoserine phosphatase)